MKTDELVTLLATQAGPVDRHAGGRRFAAAILGGTLLSALLMLGLLGLRPDLNEAVTRPMFWVKLGFAASLAWGAFLATDRLARPGRRLGRLPAALAAPVLAVWALAAGSWAGAAPDERPALFWGATWQVCPALIALLSAPIFLGVFWALKGLAPTRLALAGGTAGLFSGAAGTLVYCLHCPEVGAPFLATWYLVGMLIPGLAGMLLGCRVLRW